MYSSSASALGSELEHEVLPLVAKPHRYVGQELGGVRKDWDAARVRMLFCYPDLYEVGMSHTGTQILYHVVNRRAEWLMERAYAPWPDMELRMRERGIPLFSLESRRPAGAFDVVGFTLQSELTYTNVLTMLDLAGIPLRRAGRGDGTPLVLGGGPGAANPEPLAAFFDAFLRSSVWWSGGRATARTGSCCSGNSPRASRGCTSRTSTRCRRVEAWPGREKPGYRGR
jgi:hypothetical protein